MYILVELIDVSIGNVTKVAFDFEAFCWCILVPTMVLTVLREYVSYGYSECT